MATVAEQELRTTPKEPGTVPEVAEAPAEQTVPSTIGVCMECGALVHPDRDYCPNSDAPAVGEIAQVTHPVVWYERPRPEVEPVFPVSSLREGLPYLRRPFTKEAVRFKVQTVFKEAKGCIVVSYIDARLVSERLNYVMGGLWHDDYEPLPNELMLCRLTVDGVTRQDVGSGYKGKGLYSDALKRAGVKFGIGQSVYALRQITWFTSDAGPKGWLEQFSTQKGPSLRITEKGMTALRTGYEQWLAETGIPQFGEPIDHGDVEDSAGEEPEITAATAEVNDLPSVEQPLTDAKAHELQGKCRDLHSKVPKSKMTKAAFESQLKQASVSHEALEEFAVRLEGMAR